jgi:hypothetical protein
MGIAKRKSGNAVKVKVGNGQKDAKVSGATETVSVANAVKEIADGVRKIVLVKVTGHAMEIAVGTATSPAMVTDPVKATSCVTATCHVIVRKMQTCVRCCR